VSWAVCASIVRPRLWRWTGGEDRRL